MSRVWLFVVLFSTIVGCSSSEGEQLCEPHADPVTVLGADIMGSSLVLDVEYAGGCEEHEFDLWYGGVGAPSDPPILPLELQHDSRGDSCKSIVSEQVVFDLRPLAAVPWAEIARLHVVTGVNTSDFAIQLEVLYERPEDDSSTTMPSPTGIALRTECGQIEF